MLAKMRKLSADAITQLLLSQSGRFQLSLMETTTKESTW